MFSVMIERLVQFGLMTWNQIIGIPLEGPLDYLYVIANALMLLLAQFGL